MPRPAAPPDGSNENSGRISSRGAAVFQPGGAPADPGNGDSASEVSTDKAMSAGRKVIRLIVIRRGLTLTHSVPSPVGWQQRRTTPGSPSKK